jgi:hypothetical protein
LHRLDAPCCQVRSMQRRDDDGDRFHAEEAVIGSS